MAGRVGIDGKVQAHTSVETAINVGRVRAKLEQSAASFDRRARTLDHEVTSYELAPHTLEELRSRGQNFTGVSANYYRGMVKEENFLKAYNLYKSFVDKIEGDPAMVRGIERRRQEEQERQATQSPKMIEGNTPQITLLPPMRGNKI